MLCKESASASSSLASNQSVLVREGSLDDTASAGLCQQAAHAAAAAEHAHRLPADEIEERLHELLMEEAEDQAQVSGRVSGMQQAGCRSAACPLWGCQPGKQTG